MLYFISSAQGIKIGISENPAARTKTINTPGPHRCRLVLAIEVPDEVNVEKELQEGLEAFRLNRRMV